MIKKNNLAKMFSECLSIEESRMLSNLEELRGLVNNSRLDDSAKAKMLKHIGHLIKDTLQHARIITGLIKGAVK